MGIDSGFGTPLVNAVRDVSILGPIKLLNGPIGDAYVGGGLKNPVLTAMSRSGITIQSISGYGAHSYKILDFSFVGNGRGVLAQSGGGAGDNSQYFATFEGLTFDGVGNGFESSVPLWGSNWNRLVFNRGATLRCISNGGASKANTWGNLVFMCAGLNPSNPIYLSSWSLAAASIDIEDCHGPVIYADGGSLITIQNLDVERWTANGKALIQIEGHVTVDQLTIQSNSTTPFDIFELIGPSSSGRINTLKLSQGANITDACRKQLISDQTQIIEIPNPRYSV